MKLSYKSRFSSGSSENVLKSSVNDEFKQRSFQNSQILSQYKRKEISKKNNENQNSQIKRSHFTSNSSINRSSISTNKSRAPLKKLSAYELNLDSNDFDLKMKNQNSFNLSYFHSHDSDNDDVDFIENKGKQNKASQLNSTKAPHVSFSGKIKTSQSVNSSILNDNINDSNLGSDQKKKEIIENKNDFSKIRNNDDGMSDTIADLEKKNFVLMTDLRENCMLLNSIQKRLDQSTKDIKAKSDEIVFLKKQIVELKSKSNDSPEIDKETKKKFDENQKEVEKTDEKMKDEVLKIQLQNDELIKSNEELIKSKEQLMNENQKQIINSLNNEKNSLQAQIQTLKAQNDEFQVQETERNHNQELNLLISELKKQNNEFEMQINKLQQENQSLMLIKSENENLKGEISKIKKENEILNENQTKLLKQNEELQKIHQETFGKIEQSKNVSNEKDVPENTEDNKKENNHNEKPTLKYQIYNAYSDLSENESDDDQSCQDNISTEKHTPLNKHTSFDDHQQIQQQCFIDDFETQSYASDFSSEFSFTDGSDRNEILNSPKASIIQQLLSANQKNKVLREANAKLESVASTVMSDYTEALNKIQVLEKRNPLSIESNPTFIFENEEIHIANNENEILKQKIKDMEIKFRKLNETYSQLINTHSETFANLIRKREEIFKKEIEEMSSLKSSQQQQYIQIQSQFDSFWT